MFGGIVVTNGTVDAATAEQMSKIFLEIIVAPKFTEEAMAILTKKKNLRLLELDTTIRTYPKGERVMRKVAGGLLVQEIDDKLLPERRRLEGREPNRTDGKADGGLDAGVEDRQACEIQRHCDCQGQPEPGHRAGAGQPHLEHADGHRAQRRQGARRGAASDAFFPFDDCVKACAEAGISCIIQPGGSVRDQDSIDACDKYGIAMVFTGMRHFKH